MNLTRHFNSGELSCKCGCGGFIFNAALLIALEDVRERFNQPVTVTSSTRCLKHNAAVGGKDSSYHLTGFAADIVVANTIPSAVYSYLNSCGYSDLIGLGSYKSFTHIDVRGKRARW
jgi:uncharacterized protein YcbK (DUF882 family)